MEHFLVMGESATTPIHCCCTHNGSCPACCVADEVMLRMLLHGCAVKCRSPVHVGCVGRSTLHPTSAAARVSSNWVWCVVVGFVLHGDKYSPLLLGTAWVTGSHLAAQYSMGHWQPSCCSVQLGTVAVFLLPSVLAPLPDYSGYTTCVSQTVWLS